MFHITISRELFICKRARPAIQLTVPLFCTKVKWIDEDERKKLLRMIEYLQETQDEKLTLKTNNMTMVDWYVDAAFAVYAGMKHHKGGVLTMVKG